MASINENLRKLAGPIGLGIIFALLIAAGFSLSLSKTDWAAWVQAVGSVAAILVAVWVVQFQHRKNIERSNEDSRHLRRRQLSALKWVYGAVAERCSHVCEQIGNPHVSWALESEKLGESRRLLLSTPFDQHPDPALLIRTQELAYRLQTAIKVVYSLQQPRKPELLEKVRQIIQAVKVDALIGVTEVTDLLVCCSSQDELKADWALIDRRAENRALALQVLEAGNEAGLTVRSTETSRAAHAPPVN